ncbi:L-dopachrome tautomerase-related protein [Cupriavidus basilensis]
MPTAILRQSGSTDAQIAEQIQDLGAVGGNTDGLVTDSKGHLYITDVTRNGIVKYDPKAKSMSLVASDEGVHWPDTPAIQPGGDLVFTSSSLNDHFAGSVKPGQERYELWRLPLNVRSAKTK